MPRTTSEKTAYLLLMALMMVMGMEVYNQALLRRTLDVTRFDMPIWDLLRLVGTVIVLQGLFAGPIARKCAFRVVDPEASARSLVVLTIQVMTVALMCPSMSLAATLLFKGGWAPNLLPRWLQTLGINLPMALCWQILVAGPLVRLVVLRLPGRLLPSVAD